MAATYKQFLASPGSGALAENASLHYVPTTTSFSGPAEIIKHLNSLQKQVKKKKEDVINIIEGQGAAVFETDTGLEFITSGGTYLPGLDDNFLTDRVAYLPIVRTYSSHCSSDNAPLFHSLLTRLNDRHTSYPSTVMEKLTRSDFNGTRVLSSSSSRLLEDLAATGPSRTTGSSLS